MLLTLHISAAVWALIIGTYQLMTHKGTKRHKFVGRSWMMAMVVVAISSFGLSGFTPIFGQYSLFHVLSVWILVCIVASIYFARKGNIKRHKSFTTGAFFGLIGAGLGTLAPGRLIHEWLFGLF